MVLLPYLLVGAALSIVWVQRTGLCGAARAGAYLVYFAGASAGWMILMVLLTAVLSLGVAPFGPRTVHSRVFDRLLHHCLGMLLACCRVRLHVTGTEKVPDGSFLLVQNHRSAFDPVVTGWVLRRRQLAFVSKPENLRLPAVGAVLRKAGTLAVDRENDREALRTILTAADLLRRNVTSIAVYPEGTRNRGEGLLPFRNGAFKIAQKARVPIVITSVRGTDEIFRRFPWRHTDVFLEIRTVMDAETVKNMKTAEIGSAVREVLLSGE